MSTVEWPEKLVQEAVRVLQKNNPYLHEAEAKKIVFLVLDVVSRFGDTALPSALEHHAFLLLYKEPLLTLGELDVA